MNFRKWAIFATLSLSMGPMGQASNADPLQEVDQFVRTTLTSWIGQCLIPQNLQKPGDNPSILDLAAPLMDGTRTAAFPLYETLFIEAHSKGFGTCLAAFAKTLDDLTPGAAEAIKQSMDTLQDPSDKLAMIKGLTQVKYVWEATKRANPKTYLILQDAFELAKWKGLGYFGNGIPDGDNFELIEEICTYLDRIAAITLALNKINGDPITFPNSTKLRLRVEISKLLTEAKRDMTEEEKTRYLDYYVPSYYYIKGIIPEEQVALMPIGAAWDEAMPKPQRNLEKERADGLMNEYLLMAKMNGWEDTIIRFAQTTLGIDDAEAKLLAKKLEDVRIADPDPDKTLKARQDYMESMFTAARVVQNMRTLGVDHPYLFTYLVFLDGDALWTMDQVAGPMNDLLTLKKTKELWSGLPDPKNVVAEPIKAIAPAAKKGWFGWW